MPTSIDRRVTGSPRATGVEPAAGAGGATRSALPGEGPGGDELALRQLPLVGLVVGELLPRTPGPVAREALALAGLDGLARAGRAWDPDRHGPFVRYARSAVHSAAVTAVRSGEAGPGARPELCRRLGALLGRAPHELDEATLAGVLGIRCDELGGDLVEAHPALLDELTDPDRSEPPPEAA